jgi:hypothetical protein
MKSFFGLLAAIVPVSIANASSEPIVLGEPAMHLDFVQVPVPGGDAVELIGGQPVTPEDWPGVFYTSQGGSRCTGTVIGERVVASAAHCMGNGGTLTLQYQGQTYSGRCTHATQYRNNSTADWALCLLDTAIPDAIAETVNVDPARVAMGDTMTLMGYGCIRNGGGGGNDGTLRMGTAPITRLPSGTNHDTVTRGSAALCFGDSGGPAFVTDEETGKRYQTGINSRGNISDTSYLSSLHVETALTFYRTWSETNGVKICGVHEDAAGCRQTD